MTFSAEVIFCDTEWVSWKVLSWDIYFWIPATRLWEAQLSRWGCLWPLWVTGSFCWAPYQSQNWLLFSSVSIFGVHPSQVLENPTPSHYVPIHSNYKKHFKWELAQLWKIIINCCFKSLSARVVCYIAVYNWTITLPTKKCLLYIPLKVDFLKNVKFQILNSIAVDFCAWWSYRPSFIPF